MSQRWLLSLLAVAAAAPAVAGPNYRYVHRPEIDVYFGHISYCELKHDANDPRVLRVEGPQPATVNLPLAPGDTLQTTSGRRCEAQFDTGTVLRLDEASGVWIETILARSLTTNDKLTNLHLREGRLNVLYRDYDSQEVFQILTPNAAVMLGRAAVVDVRLTADGETVVDVARGQASLLYGPSATKTRTRRLKAGERATVGKDDQLASVASSRDRAKDAFDEWNRVMNERFVELHSGKSALPKPIERFPRAVIYFAQRYADPYGEWIWSELYGYVWRPYLSRDEGWMPYQQGRWVPMSGRQFWVPDEPWGWVPYHLGLWHWDKKHGWVWLPGSAFAPAWVSWGMCDDLRYFRPLTLWDWGMRYGRSYRYRLASTLDPCGLYPDWIYQTPTTVTVAQSEQPAPALKPDPADEGGLNPIRKIPELPLLPLPKELAALARKAEILAQRADPDLRAAIEHTSRSAPGAGKENTMPLADVAEAVEARPPIARFRDWNADVKAARNVGGHIVYSSVTNMVRCESCSQPLINFAPFSGSSDSGRGMAGSGGGSDNSSSGSSGSSGTASMAGIAGGGSSGGSANMAGVASGERKQD